MEITPRMIRDVVFRERLRGYDEDHVDEFLERVATGVEILQERLRQAAERAELAERRSSERLEGDDALRRTEEGIPSLVPSPPVHDAPLPPRPDQWGEWEAPSLTHEVVAQDASPEPVPEAVADAVTDAAGAAEPATAFWPSAQPLPEPEPQPAEPPARPEAVAAEAVAPGVFAMPPPQ